MLLDVLMTGSKGLKLLHDLLLAPIEVFCDHFVVMTIQVHQIYQLISLSLGPILSRNLTCLFTLKLHKQVLVFLPQYSWILNDAFDLVMYHLWCSSKTFSYFLCIFTIYTDQLDQLTDLFLGPIVPVFVVRFKCVDSLKYIWILDQ